MRDDEMGLSNFGGDHMYLAIITWMRNNYPEILSQWEHKVRDAVEWAEPKRLN